MEATCSMLLHRCGIVFREPAGAQKPLAALAPIAGCLYGGLEDRGERSQRTIHRRASSASSFMPMRAWNHARTAAAGTEPGERAAAEFDHDLGRRPLNLVESCAPAISVPAVSGRRLTLHNGGPPEERQPDRCRSAKLQGEHFAAAVANDSASRCRRLSDVAMPASVRRQNQEGCTDLPVPTNCWRYENGRMSR